MIPTTHLLAFTLTALVLIAIPGPSVLFTGRSTPVVRSVLVITPDAGEASGMTARAVAMLALSELLKFKTEPRD